VAVLLDLSAIIAAADTADLNHAAARTWFGSVDVPLLVGALTLGEADHVLQRELGQPATIALVEALTSGAVRLVSPTNEDLVRAAALLVEHAEHRPRLSDALLVAAPGAWACTASRRSTGGRSRCWCRVARVASA
jgi:predicted nucleic acid-binding protein